MRRAFALLLSLFALLLPCRAAYDGVTLTEKTVETHGIERTVYLLTVDPSRAELLLATPGDDEDNDGGDGHGASLLSMAEAAESADRHIVAAVNGDFYKTSSDGAASFAPYAALGVMVKNGRILSEGQRALGAAFFGITKDGTAMIGSAEAGGEWDEVKDTLVTAIGGELLLIRHGESNLPDLRWRTDSYILADRYGGAGRALDDDGNVFSDAVSLSYHPRTAIGVRADGTVVICAASIGYSTAGFSIIELTDILLEAGCVEAMNLDGGPSTQLCYDGGEGLSQLVSRGISGRIGDGLLVCVSENAENDGGRSSDTRIRLVAVSAMALAVLTVTRRRSRRSGK